MLDLLAAAYLYSIHLSGVHIQFVRLHRRYLPTVNLLPTRPEHDRRVDFFHVAVYLTYPERCLEKRQQDSTAP
jgi:hypothetical protein